MVILALDQGTTSSRAMLFDHGQQILGMSQKATRQIYPQPGWVEQDPMEIWATQYGVMQEVLAQTGHTYADVAAIGLANQRETTIVWERATGKPVYNAIVWQCRRTAAICQQMQADGWQAYVQEATGLVIDAYFSATKLKWILDEIDPLRQRASRGELLFGTVDSWLIWKLTGGQVHATDYTNASRTMLYNIRTLRWDEKLLDYLQIPLCMLPQVCPSTGTVGYFKSQQDEQTTIPIAGVAGDQQAALFGQGCFLPGMSKNTYGTGCFLLMHTGTSPISSQHGLLTTIALGTAEGVTYALEGSVFVAGAGIQWLRDEMHLINAAEDTAYFAEKIPDNAGVYVVPAFTGLGAPYWDMSARGSIYGLTRGTNRNHIIRATLEAIAYQSKDVMTAMIADAGLPLTHLKVDGGASQNDFLMQFQADMLDVDVIRPQITESTALGAALLAGLTVDYWKDLEEVSGTAQTEQIFSPRMSPAQREKNYAGWLAAVGRTMHQPQA